MTKSTRVARCPWCGGEFPISPGPGRPRRFCRRSHRQRYYEARRLATAMGLETDDVLIGRTTLTEWQDRMVVVEAALDDVEADLRGRPSAEEYRAAFRHLYAAAEPLRRLRVEPRGIGAIDLDE